MPPRKRNLLQRDDDDDDDDSDNSSPASSADSGGGDTSSGSSSSSSGSDSSSGSSDSSSNGSERSDSSSPERLEEKKKAAASSPASSSRPATASASATAAPVGTATAAAAATLTFAHDDKDRIPVTMKVLPHFFAQVKSRVRGQYPAVDYFNSAIQMFLTQLNSEYTEQRRNFAAKRQAPNAQYRFTWKNGGSLAECFAILCDAAKRLFMAVGKTKDGKDQLPFGDFLGGFASYVQQESGISESELPNKRYATKIHDWEVGGTRYNTKGSTEDSTKSNVHFANVRARLDKLKQFMLTGVMPTSSSLIVSENVDGTVTTTAAAAASSAQPARREVSSPDIATASGARRAQQQQQFDPDATLGQGGAIRAGGANDPIGVRLASSLRPITINPRMRRRDPAAIKTGRPLRVNAVTAILPGCGRAYLESQRKNDIIREKLRAIYGDNCVSLTLLNPFPKKSYAQMSAFVEICKEVSIIVPRNNVTDGEEAREDPLEDNNNNNNRTNNTAATATTSPPPATAAATPTAPSTGAAVFDVDEGQVIVQLSLIKAIEKSFHSIQAHFDRQGGMKVVKKWVDEAMIANRSFSSADTGIYYLRVLESVIRLNCRFSNATVAEWSKTPSVKLNGRVLLSSLLEKKAQQEQQQIGGSTSATAIATSPSSSSSSLLFNLDWMRDYFSEFAKTELQGNARMVHYVDAVVSNLERKFLDSMATTSALLQQQQQQQSSSFPSSSSSLLAMRQAQAAQAAVGGLRTTAGVVPSAGPARDHMNRAIRVDDYDKESRLQYATQQSNLRRLQRLEQTEQQQQQGQSYGNSNNRTMFAQATASMINAAPSGRGENLHIFSDDPEYNPAMPLLPSRGFYNTNQNNSAQNNNNKKNKSAYPCKGLCCRTTEEMVAELRECLDAKQGRKKESGDGGDEEKEEEPAKKQHRTETKKENEEAEDSDAKNKTLRRSILSELQHAFASDIALEAIDQGVAALSGGAGSKKHQKTPQHQHVIRYHVAYDPFKLLGVPRPASLGI